jgi:hypothetical protein
VNAWSVVDSLGDFAEYLFLLARDAERERAAGRPWPNAAIPAFLAALADLVEPRHACVDFVEVFGPPPMTGWHDVARLLHGARSVPPAVDLARLAPVADSDAVADAVGLQGYLRWLIEDFRADQAERAVRAAAGLWALEGRWSHTVIEDWLGVWGGWLQDWYLRALPDVPDERRRRVEPATWATIAFQLSAARVYE